MNIVFESSIYFYPHILGCTSDLVITLCKTDILYNHT